MRGREQFNKFKSVFSVLSKIVTLFPMRFRVSLFNWRRNTPGKIGMGIRYALLRSIANSCGDNVAVFEGVYIKNPQNLSVGSNVSIHPMSYLECGYEPCGITIGNDVSIAHGVTIMATTHNYTQDNVSIRDQGIATRPVRIGNNVWIGAKATVTAGCMVEEGCIIGANAVVTRNTAFNGVYAGIPAKRIKDRVRDICKEG